MPTTPPLPPIRTATTIDGVVDEIGSIIDWSISSSSRLGYFAALYKRITVAVRMAIADGAFQNGARMERFDVTFANRYFDALNGYFHPGRYPKPTRSWRVTFDVATDSKPIIVQHMLAGVNAHIDLDLGIAAATVCPGTRLHALREDFMRVNAVLASQVNGVVDDIGQLSPALADLYGVLREHGVFLINEAVKVFRDSAWRFATLLAFEPAFARPPTIWLRDRKVARQVELLYDPPSVIGVLAAIVDEIAERESRDIAHNIMVLDEIAATPAPITTAM